MADPENVADNTSQDIVISDRQLFDHAIAPDSGAGTPHLYYSRKKRYRLNYSLRRSNQQNRCCRGIHRGRFAPKPAQGENEKAAPQQQPQRQPEDHRVPLRELLDERERRQRIEAEAHQMRQAWAQFQAQQQAAAQQQQAPQTIFDNPEDYLAQRVVEPLRQEMQARELQRTDKMSREFDEPISLAVRPSRPRSPT